MKVNKFPLETQRIIERLPFTANGYTFSDVIGTGAYSVVFKVYSSRYNQEFAAKLIPVRFELDPDNMNVCGQEIKALKRLSHANIIKLFETFKMMNHVILILQLCENGNLDQLLKKRKRVDSNCLIPFMKQCLDALEYCHSQNIAHRDIKPDNIFIDSQHHVLLADFGFAKIVENRKRATEFCGSFSYKSPELINKQPYDPMKCDVWALGVTFYKMIIGSKPWPSKDDYPKLLDAMINGKFTIPSYVNQEIAFALRRMIEPNFEKRAAIAEINHLPVFNTNEAISKDYFVCDIPKIHQSQKHNARTTSLISKTTKCLYPKAQSKLPVKPSNQRSLALVPSKCNSMSNIFSVKKMNMSISTARSIIAS